MFNFFDKVKNKNIEDPITKIAALLIHVSKIDESYTEKERERLYKAVYEDPHWVNDIGPRVAKVIHRDKIMVQRVVPTKKSTAQG